MSTNKLLPKELTFLSIVIGIIVAIIMTAANVYLGLYAGMTVSASIPASVIAISIFQILLRKNSILESNIVQTMASAGESLAAGVIFTLPALLLVGAWQDFKFWPTTLIAICGGVLGVIFMIPLRKTLIIKEKELIYPEGVACARVLQSADNQKASNIKLVFNGLAVGGIFKLITSGLGILANNIEKAWLIGKKIFFIGFDASCALLAVGFIVKLEVACLVFIGGVISWGITLPLISVHSNILDTDILELAWKLWSTKIRYIGVGAMVVGGLASIITVRHGIKNSLKELTLKKTPTTHQDSTNIDMSLTATTILFVMCFLGIFYLYSTMLSSMGLSLLTTITMIIISFPIVAVSSYIVGLVGSSNNPVSGITIAVLLATSALFLALGLEGNSAILSTLGVASIVCCAACTAGDCSQDLKTGALIKATPKHQQIAQIIAIITSAFVIAPILSLLHATYGIGVELKAPQATLFAGITNSLFGAGNLPYNMIAIGVVIGCILLIGDYILKKSGYKFRLHVMPLAVGIYLPITLAVTMFVGGIIRYLVDKSKNNTAIESGVLLSSGLIAGEAIMGILIAIVLTAGISLELSVFNLALKEFLTIVCFSLIVIYLWKQSTLSSVVKK